MAGASLAAEKSARERAQASSSALPEAPFFGKAARPGVPALAAAGGYTSFFAGVDGATLFQAQTLGQQKDGQQKEGWAPEKPDVGTPQGQPLEGVPATVRAPVPEATGHAAYARVQQALYPAIEDGVTTQFGRQTLYDLVA